MSNDDLQWLRQYKIHQENILYSRINIFILVSSIFLGIFGVVLSQDVRSQDVEIAFAVSCLGTIITIVWWLAVHRQRIVVNDLRRRLYKHDTLYRKRRIVRDKLDKKQWKRIRRISGQRLVIDVLPATFLVVWVVAVFWLALREHTECL